MLSGKDGWLLVVSTYWMVICNYIYLFLLAEQLHWFEGWKWTQSQFSSKMYMRKTFEFEIYLYVINFVKNNNISEKKSKNTRSLTKIKNKILYLFVNFRDSMLFRSTIICFLQNNKKYSRKSKYYKDICISIAKKLKLSFLWKYCADVCFYG